MGLIEDKKRLDDAKALLSQTLVEKGQTPTGGSTINDLVALVSRLKPEKMPPLTNFQLATVVTDSEKDLPIPETIYSAYTAHPESTRILFFALDNKDFHTPPSGAMYIQAGYCDPSDHIRVGLGKGSYGYREINYEELPSGGYRPVYSEYYYTGLCSVGLGLNQNDATKPSYHEAGGFVPARQQFSKEVQLRENYGARFVVGTAYLMMAFTV